MIKGEVPCVKIFEDKDYFVFLDHNPLQIGHTLVLPKKHTDYIFELKDIEYKNLMLKVKDIANNLKLKLKSKRIGLIVEGFGVAHVHVHLVPINHQYELDLIHKKSATNSELEKIARIISGQ